MIIFICLFNFFLGKNILSQINEVINALEKIRVKNNISSRLPENRKDEFNQLYVKLNEFLEQICDNFMDVKVLLKCTFYK